MCIGLKIKDLASKRNITLAELAKRLGKTKQAVYEILEKDDVNTSIVRSCAKIFHVPVSYFFDDETTNIAIANGDSAVSANGNVHIANSDSKRMEEKIKYLEQILKEKERLIKILMERK